MDRSTREQVVQRCREMLGDCRTEEPIGVAVLDKIDKLRDIPQHLRDGDLQAFIAGQNFMEDHVNIPAFMSNGNISDDQAASMSLYYLIAHDMQPYTSTTIILPPALEPVGRWAERALSAGDRHPTGWRLNLGARTKIANGDPEALPLVIGLLVGSSLTGCSMAPTLEGMSPVFTGYTLAAEAVKVLETYPQDALREVLEKFTAIKIHPEMLKCIALSKLLDRGSFALHDESAQAQDGDMQEFLRRSAIDLLRMDFYAAKSHLLATDVLWHLGFHEPTYNVLHRGLDLAEQKNQPFTKAMLLSYEPKLLFIGAEGLTITLGRLKQSCAAVTSQLKAKYQPWILTGMANKLEQRLRYNEALLVMSTGRGSHEDTRVINISDIHSEPAWGQSMIHSPLLMAGMDFPPGAGPATPAPVRPDRSVCAGCGTQSAHMKKCGRCKSVYYCSVDCQGRAWKQHKRVCVQLSV